MTLASDLVAPEAMHMPACRVLSCASSSSSKLSLEKQGFCLPSCSLPLQLVLV